ncbi:MAG: MFS transporter [Sphingobacteriia bacterium]|nr:MAG: MFS transporter [Sphingobacteriia bacterium]
MNDAIISPKTHRIAIASFFFIAGICFASWASRIPNIKQQLGLSEAALGGLLLALPVGSMTSLPISGWLVSRFGSKRIMQISSLVYPILLIGIGYSNSIFHLASLLFLFGLFGNMMNISVNTQAVGVEHLYKRTIMASFHGVWSLAGFTGAAIGTLMIGLGISPLIHFVIIALLTISISLIAQSKAIAKDDNKTGSTSFAKPDMVLLKLGLIAFCCMAAEGTMFDWSGVYFQKIVHAPNSLITIGYAAFMCSMATGRFVGDKLVANFGKKRMLQASGIVIAIGLLIAVVFPTLLIATIGFLLVGFGVSSVVPLVYSQAGKSTKLSPGMALAAVSSIGFLGFLVGPPIIGFVAESFVLQWSFTMIAFLGLGTSLLARFTKFID